MAKDSCEHLENATDGALPSSRDGCEDCLREGSDWVHLRKCLACGHVGCCDSSPRQHATAHFRRTKHPVIRSIEPAESWRWCYVDEIMADAPAAAGAPLVETG